MPVDFDGSADFIAFASNSIYDGLGAKSLFLRTISEGDGSDNIPKMLWKTGAADQNGWSAGRNDSGFARPNRLHFVQTGTGGVGLWETNDNTFNQDTEYSVGVSMDIGNINNTPLFYLGGVSVAVNEITAPGGAFHTTDTEGLNVGRAGGTVDAGEYEGKIWDIHIANVVWTPAEFASLHESNAPGYWMRGLIFYPQMNGAAGLQAFDGAALGAANKIVDVISGILGTPTSNPLGVADTVLAV